MYRKIHTHNFLHIYNSNVLYDIIFKEGGGGGNLWSFRFSFFISQELFRPLGYCASHDYIIFLHLLDNYRKKLLLAFTGIQTLNTNTNSHTRLLSRRYVDEIVFILNILLEHVWKFPDQTRVRQGRLQTWGWWKPWWCFHTRWLERSYPLLHRSASGSFQTRKFISKNVELPSHVSEPNWKVIASKAFHLTVGSEDYFFRKAQ